MTPGNLALLAAKSEVDVSAHMPMATNLLLLAIGLIALMFVVRYDLWRRIFLQPVDPRPAALMRISFGFVVLLTFIDFVKPHGPLEDSVARFLFTDEGLWLTDMARQNYGGKLKSLWDPEHGFEHWYGIFVAMWGKFSILHFRSDPTFVFGLYALMITSLTLMIVGVWTRTMTIVSWVLVESIYRYSPVFYTGGDTVVRVFLFLGMFTRWGEAYSIDSWRRRRTAILSGATVIPALRRIPAWPVRLMMVQLAIIYCATGLLKSGTTWADGTALFYTLNLDHFYRWPQMGLVGILQYLHILPITTVFVHWWEVLFPLVLIGMAVNAYERDRAAGRWPQVGWPRRALGYLLFLGAWGIGAYFAGLGVHYYVSPKALEAMQMNRLLLVKITIASVFAIPFVVVGLYQSLRRFFPRVHTALRHWVLGKRFWLVVGLGMHWGINLGMNVGTFAEVMMAVYFVWLSGEEIEAFWRYVFSRPIAPTDPARPQRKNRWLRMILAPIDRLLFRTERPALTVIHHPGESSVRRAALLRVWDLGHRLEFRADPDIAPEQLLVKSADSRSSAGGSAAGYRLIRVFPGLWWMRGIRHLPGLRSLCGSLAMKILRQH